MSRRNYIHTMDSLIGKPFYSNAAGALLDPSTGLEVSTMPTFEQAPDESNPYTSTSLVAPIAVAVEPTDDLERIKIETERRELEANKLLLAKKQAEYDAQKLAEKQTLILPVAYVAPPIIMGGGGGGGALGEPSRPAPSAPIVAKPSFLKKNFIPLLLVTSAIFVFIKKPIK